MYNSGLPGKLISGVHAAVGTPRDEHGRLDEPAFRTTLQYLMGHGVTGFAINGATGEYCLTTPAELTRLVAITRELTAGRASVLCGIGSAGIHGCLENAAIAVQGGVTALLLPMPHFFPYAQTDLEAFCIAVAQNLAQHTEAAVLLYNLPFTSALEPHTVQTLLETCPNIIGIKDSSGSLDILRHLTRTVPSACRIVGSDGVLQQALIEGVCDGVISGVASVLPRLILTLYREGSASAAASLQQFIHALSPFPTPWGLKLTGEYAGIMPASFSQPLSPERRVQAEALKAWFLAWRESL